MAIILATRWTGNNFFKGGLGIQVNYLCPDKNSLPSFTFVCSQHCTCGLATEVCRNDPKRFWCVCPCLLLYLAQCRYCLDPRKSNVPLDFDNFQLIKVHRQQKAVGGYDQHLLNFCLLCAVHRTPDTFSHKRIEKSNFKGFVKKWVIQSYDRQQWSQHDLRFRLYFKDYVRKND